MSLPQVNIRCQYPRGRNLYLAEIFIPVKRNISHPLDRWLQERGIKQYIFAKKVRASAKHISQVIHGHGISPHLAELIERETQGGVTADELLRIAGNKPHQKSLRPTRKARAASHGA